MLAALCLVRGGGGRPKLSFFFHIAAVNFWVFTILPAKLWWIKGFEHHQGCWYCGCSADLSIWNSYKYCGPWWGWGNRFLLSSFSFVTKREQKSPRSDNVAAPCDRVFFSWRNKCLVCSSRFCFSPYSNNKKQKTPVVALLTSSGQGSIPCGVLLFKCCRANFY